MIHGKIRVQRVIFYGKMALEPIHNPSIQKGVGKWMDHMAER